MKNMGFQMLQQDSKKSMAISWAGEKPTIHADGTMTEHPELQHATPSAAHEYHSRKSFKDNIIDNV